MKVRQYRRVEQMYLDGVSEEVCFQALLNILEKDQYADVGKWIKQFHDFLLEQKVNRRLKELTEEEIKWMLLPTPAMCLRIMHHMASAYQHFQLFSRLDDIINNGTNLDAMVARVEEDNE